MPITRTIPVLAVATMLTLPCLTGCGGGNSQESFLANLIEPMLPPSPSEAARDAFNVHDADARRRSVALLSSAPFGGEEPYLRTYRLLMDDPDATVRAACVKALGVHGSVDDALLIIPRLGDEAAFVRWEAAKALQRIHHPQAIGPLVSALKDESDADVRMAAAAALGQYAHPAVFDALVGMLTDPNYGVARAAASSLRTLTGQAIGDDPSAWLAWSRDRRGALFANQQAYVYQPYVEPPGMLEKMRFWTEAQPVEPRRPVGLEPVAPKGDDEA